MLKEEKDSKAWLFGFGSTVLGAGVVWLGYQYNYPPVEVALAGIATISVSVIASITIQGICDKYKNEKKISNRSRKIVNVLKDNRRIKMITFSLKQFDHMQRPEFTNTVYISKQYGDKQMELEFVGNRAEINHMHDPLKKQYSIGISREKAWVNLYCISGEKRIKVDIVKMNELGSDEKLDSMVKSFKNFEYDKVLSVYEEKQHSIESKKNREIKKTLKVKNTKDKELENNER